MISPLEHFLVPSYFDTTIVAGAYIAPLNPEVEWMRFCDVCNSEQRFVADRICPSGLVGRCANCRDERIASFTRTSSEVA